MDMAKQKHATLLSQFHGEGRALPARMRKDMTREEANREMDAHQKRRKQRK